MQSDACTCSNIVNVSVILNFQLHFCFLPISETLSLAMASSSSTGNLLPYFDFDVQRNVTVTVGQTGFLHCRVERLGDKDVSIRMHSRRFARIIYLVKTSVLLLESSVLFTWYVYVLRIQTVCPQYYAILINT